MDDLEDFEQKRRNFQISRKANKMHFVKLENLRKQFLRKFPQDKLSDLDIDQYVEGKGNKDSFCNWLENRIISIMRGKTRKNMRIFFLARCHLSVRMTQLVNWLKPEPDLRGNVSDF